MKLSDSKLCVSLKDDINLEFVEDKLLLGCSQAKAWTRVDALTGGNKMGVHE